MKYILGLLSILVLICGTTWVHSQNFVTPAIGANTCAYTTGTLPALIPNSYNIVQCADACQTAPHIFVPISITSATTTQLLAGSAGKKIYICYLSLAAGAVADNVAIVEGTGATCAGGTAGIIGGITTANGINLTAASNISFLANFSAIGVTAAANDNVCLITSSGGPLAGVAVFAQQ